MTDNEVDRLSRQLTDVRIQIAGEFATIKAELASIKSNSGKFTWADVLKVVVAIAAVVPAVYALKHW